MIERTLPKGSNKKIMKHQTIRLNQDYLEKIKIRSKTEIREKTQEINFN